MVIRTQEEAEQAMGALVDWLNAQTPGQKCNEDPASGLAEDVENFPAVTAVARDWCYLLLEACGANGLGACPLCLA